MNISKMSHTWKKKTPQRNQTNKNQHENENSFKEKLYTRKKYTHTHTAWRRFYLWNKNWHEIKICECEKNFITNLRKCPQPQGLSCNYEERKKLVVIH